MVFNYTKDLVRRSRLIMPANQRKSVNNAYLRNADTIVLDLEDSVPQSEKAAARNALRELIGVAGQGGSDVFVRVNTTEEMLTADVKGAVWPGLTGIYLPKTESAGQVQALEKLIAQLEKERGIPAGHIKISIIIETAKGYINVNEIAQASARVDTLTLGMEDFLRDMGMVANEDTYYALLAPRLQIALVARAHGKAPMGLFGSLANYRDGKAFEKSALLAYQHGFLGASCIHPGNVEILNRCFSPQQEEIDRSRRIIAAFEAALAQGKAATTFEGKMIDYVHYDQAKALLARQQTIEAFELRKKQAREAIQS